MRWVLLLTAMALVGCGANKPYDKEPSRLDALRERRISILEGVYSKLDVNGWASSTDCDGLLWASLGAAAQIRVNLAVAEYEPGEMHRRPTPCYPGESKSEISNDMILGYLWAARGDQGALERLATYGEAHNWVMGVGAVERTVLKPNLQGLLGRLLGKFGVAKSYAKIPPVYPQVDGDQASDYERHLQALGIALYGELDGSVTDQMLDRLHNITAVEPDNALYAVVLDRYEGSYRGVDLLMAEPGAPHMSAPHMSAPHLSVPHLSVPHLSAPHLSVPTYVRGENLPALADIEWLFAAQLALNGAALTDAHARP